MNTTIFIPKTIKVGYQNRSDTYTGQLAYVIYYDQKNKLRKENSWQSWRDKNIEPQEFVNEPTSGFVLNKKVGDYVSDWNHRQAYVRVYDPRNFEFEVTIENLLYILENASSIKGKGLEGNFIFGWDGKDLLLMPVDSPDYKEITEYNEMIFQKNYVKAKELILGATYKTKTNEEYIYMGRFDYHTTEYERIERPQDRGWYIGYRSYDSVEVDVNKGKHHFFINKESKYCIDILTIKSLGERFISTVSTDCVEDYAELFEKLEVSTKYSPIDKSKDEYIQYTFEEFCEKLKDRGLYCYNKQNENLYVTNFYNDPSRYYFEDRNDYTNKKTEGTLEEIYNILQPSYKNVYLSNNKLYSEGK